jgi:hypothetical protein
MTIEFAIEQLLKKTVMQKGFRNRKWAFNIFFQIMQGAIPKRRLLRGGGRGSPPQSLFSNLSRLGEGGGVINSEKMG